MSARKGPLPPQMVPSPQRGASHEGSLSAWCHQFPGHDLGQRVPRDDLVVPQMPASTGDTSTLAQPTGGQGTNRPG